MAEPMEESYGVSDDDVDMGKLQSLVEGALDEEELKPEGEEDDVNSEDAEQDQDEEATAEEDDQESEDADESDSELKLVDKEGKVRAVSLNDLLEKTEHDLIVNGETDRVGYEELIARAQKGTDYQRKTEALAKEKKEIQPFSQMVAYAQSDPQFVQYVAEYIQNGGIPEHLVMGAAGNVSDEELAELHEEDPKRAQEILRNRAALKKQYHQRRQANEAAALEAQRMMTEWVEAEESKTRELIPDYDNKKALSYLSELGFSEQELAAPMDHRMKQVIHEASKYRELKSKSTDKGKLDSKRKGPVPPRKMRSGSGKPITSKRKVQKATYNKAMETQNDDDWVKVIAERMGF